MGRCTGLHCFTRPRVWCAPAWTIAPFTSIHHDVWTMCAETSCDRSSWLSFRLSRRVLRGPSLSTPSFWQTIIKGRKEMARKGSKGVYSFLLWCFWTNWIYNTVRGADLLRWRDTGEGARLEMKIGGAGTLSCQRLPNDWYTSVIGSHHRPLSFPPPFRFTHTHFTLVAKIQSISRRCRAICMLDNWTKAHTRERRGLHRLHRSIWLGGRW